MGPMLGPIVGTFKMKIVFNKNVSIYQKELLRRGAFPNNDLLFGGPASVWGEEFLDY